MQLQTSAGVGGVSYTTSESTVDTHTLNTCRPTSHTESLLILCYDFLKRIVRTYVTGPRVAKAAGNGSTAAAEPRGVLILPGLANNSADYAGLSQHLHDRGLSTRVVQVCSRLHTIECHAPKIVVVVAPTTCSDSGNTGAYMTEDYQRVLCRCAQAITLSAMHRRSTLVVTRVSSGSRTCEPVMLMQQHV